MLARGFRGDFVSLHPAAFTTRDWLFLATSSLAIAAARLAAQVAP
jgi:energy-coupling factor transporter transmembrane protein EcfT